MRLIRSHSDPPVAAQTAAGWRDQPAGFTALHESAFRERLSSIQPRRLERRDPHRLPPPLCVALGVAFSVVTTLLILWVASRFPDMEISTAYWIIGAACPTLIATPVCIILVRQAEQNLRLSEELRASVDALRRLADHDQMTGLFNRATFLQQVETTHAAEAGAGAFILVDVDSFKAINDSVGHHVGDKVLQQVAGALVTGIGPGDLCGRIGGEEFAIYLIDADIEAAARVAEKLRMRVEALRIDADQDREVRPTISVGVASGMGVTSVEDGLRRADRAMYSAKRHGRNRVHLAH